ncbi:MAG: asparaginase domain-containing protein [Planctomycetota bacterium]|jgi:L-asparaginase
MAKKRIAVISTGGTVEKTYDALEGVLHNEFSVLDIMLADLKLEGVEIVRVPLMNKDSLEMTEADHVLIARTAESMGANHDGVVVLHGTDRLALSGEKMVELLGTPRVPVVLTGAMQPYVMRHSDAMQNVTEALLAVQIVEPGIHVAIHNKILTFPGVVKDRSRGTFIKAANTSRTEAT